MTGEIKRSQKLLKGELETIYPDGQLMVLNERKESHNNLEVSSFGDLVSTTTIL